MDINEMCRDLRAQAEAVAEKVERLRDHSMEVERNFEAVNQQLIDERSKSQALEHENANMSEALQDLIYAAERHILDGHPVTPGDLVRIRHAVEHAHTTTY